MLSLDSARPTVYNVYYNFDLSWGDDPMSITTNKAKRTITLLLTSAFVFSAALLIPQKVWAYSWSISKIDEQRACNLTPEQLDTWAEKKGYNISWNWNQNKDVLIATVEHEDDTGELWESLLNAGKVAVDTYQEAAVDAVKDLPFAYLDGDVELNADSISEYVDSEATDEVMSVNTAVDMIDTALSKENGLLVISNYCFDSYDKSAFAAEVYMSKKGRGGRYSLSQLGNDLFEGTTKDGYSIKPDHDDHPGYYYKQETVQWGDVDYWHIILKPMYQR